jgi:cellulose synthase/poly-beta-1,6-N-acetylglucosamine synthase-like glycosyltransferase
MMMTLFCLTLLVVYLVVQVILFVSMAATKPDAQVELNETDWPKVSILVAVRNEEEHILNCLRSLAELDYPAEKLQILIGNDQSDDQTKPLVQEFIRNKSNFTLIDINQQLGKAQGKANVLAHLAKKATGSVWCITDADIVVNHEWVRELLRHFTSPQVGIVSGTTLVYNRSILGQLQGIDWLYFMGLIKGFDNAGIPCTAVGNNMAITREAYESTGGYEALDFSVTEDFKLYAAVRKQGWLTRNILTRNSLNVSAPVGNIKTLLHQRKRWLMGARELPFYWWLLFALLASFVPAVLVFAVYQPVLALQIYGIKLLLQSLFILLIQHKLGIRQNVFLVLLYELYATAISFATSLFFMLPVKVQWKKREY